MSLIKFKLLSTSLFLLIQFVTGNRRSILLESHGILPSLPQNASIKKTFRNQINHENKNGSRLGSNISYDEAIKESQQFAARYPRSKISSFLKPALRNLAILYQPPSLASIGFGLTCGIGCYFHAEAKNTGDSVHSTLHGKERTELPLYEVVGRVILFWKKVAPIIVHYKFATVWMNRVKSYDRERRDEIYDSLHQRYAPHSKEVIYDMKGLFIKIGQVMSSRPDFMPSIYIDHFSELQDNVPAYPTDDIKAIISTSLLNHHGLEFDQVFETFADDPLGSASIGQVHAATLTDNFMQLSDGYSGGKDVAVKVMHIDAQDRFRNDFKILKWLCRVALPGWSPILPELERQFMTEFDYKTEAANLDSVRKNMLASPFKNRVRVPEPINKFSTRNVLIMEKLEGEKLVSVAENKLTEVLKGDKNLARTLLEARRKAIMNGDVSESTTKDEIQMVKDSIKHHSKLARISIMWKLASIVWTQRKNVELLLDVHGYQIFINGQFNGDPHPGNILILPNGQLGLIDYGQCYKLKTEDRVSLSSIVQELGKAEIDDTTLASEMRKIGFRFKYYKDDVIREMAKLFFDSDSARIKLGLPTPQELYMHLNSQDPMEFVPDAAVFVARTSFLFRGMGTMIGMDVNTAFRWRNHAMAALQKS